MKEYRYTTISILMSAIVSVDLKGGLGNQLFQIFTCMAHGLESNKDFMFSYTNELKCGTVRSTYWETFLSELRNYTTYNNTTISNATLACLPQYCETSFRYVKIPENTIDRVLLVGYFQSYKYFENSWGNISNAIKLSDQQASVKTQYADLFTDKTTISMHHRLGDYVNIQQCHPLMPYSYYYNAICNILMGKTHSIRVLYFCQEIDNESVSKIVSRLQTSFSEVEFVKVDDAIEDWKQMLIMSCCDHNIIANSTYSWWAAYFNSNKNKHVCYPSNWFGPALTHNTVDLFPSDWQKIYW